MIASGKARMKRLILLVVLLVMLPVAATTKVSGIARRKVAAFDERYHMGRRFREPAIKGAI